MLVCHRCASVIDIQQEVIHCCESCGKTVCEHCFDRSAILCRYCKMYSPESSVKEVTNTYDDIAAEYDDRIFGADSTFEAHRKERVFTETELEFLLSKISVKDRVLELGCGTGRVTIPIARKAACVTAVDISQSMLKVACEKAHAASVSHKISFLQQDMTSLSLPPESFSTVVSSLAL